jgi:hypothetical protein
MLLSSVLFVVVAVAIILLAIAASLGITHIYLRSSEAIQNDGLPRGMGAPLWTLKDSRGDSYSSPSRSGLQLILFTDQSLKSFPAVVEGIQRLTAEGDVQIVVLLRRHSERAEPTIRAAGLIDVPIITGSERLYGKYNVRVMPFAIFVGPEGLVRACSLVNHAWQITTLRSIAEIVPIPTGWASQLRRFRVKRPSQVRP